MIAQTEPRTPEGRGAVKRPRGKGWRSLRCLVCGKPSGSWVNMPALVNGGLKVSIYLSARCDKCR